MTFAKASVGQLTDEWARSIGLPSHYRPETDSTNKVAKEMSVASETPRFLVVTDHQTQGRGRGQNTWSDVGRGEQLLSTWVFQKHHPFQHTAAQLFGLALYHAASSVYPRLPWSLKAPNDLYINHLKVAGLLIEIVTGGPTEQAIVGLGFNIHNHPYMIDTATHLTHYEPAALENWFVFLAKLLEQFSWAADEATRPQLSEDTQKQLLHALNRHLLLKEKYTAVDAEGNLTTPTRHIRWTDL